jgi:hypothetical protein
VDKTHRWVKRMCIFLLLNFYYNVCTNSQGLIGPHFIGTHAYLEKWKWGFKSSHRYKGKDVNSVTEAKGQVRGVSWLNSREKLIWAKDIVQVVKYLPSKSEALSSRSSTTRKELLFIKNTKKIGMLVLVCNPNYSECGYLEDCGSRPTPAKR